MNYEERTREIFARAKKYRAGRRRAAAAAIGLCVCAAVGFGCVLFVPYPAGGADLSAYRGSEYYSLMQTIEPLARRPIPYRNNFEKWTSGWFPRGGLSVIPGIDEGGNDASAALPDGGGSGTVNDGYQETTDNQVRGVTEGDLFKRTDEYLFYLTYGHCDSGEKSVYSGQEYALTLRIYSLQGKNSSLAGEYTLETGENYQLYYQYADRAELYLSEDGGTVTILTQLYDEEAARVYTALIPLDVSKPASVRQGPAQYVSGAYVSSRVRDGKLYVVTNFTVRKNPDFSDEAQFLPQAGGQGELRSLPAADIAVPDSPAAARYTVVCAYEEGEIFSHVAFLAYASETYVSAGNIYLTRLFTQKDDAGAYREYTEIARVSYADGLEYLGSAVVEGAVRNQYSMDEREGLLRVVSTVCRQGANSSASLFCVDIRSFEIVAALERFAPPGEEVKSVRFNGDTVNVCTAVALRDPVFVIDLSDLADISVKDTGEIGGYSVALRQFTNGTLLGIGYDEDFSLKVELYAETETGVESVVQYRQSAVFSEEYKSYFIDEARGLIGLAVFGYDQQAEYRSAYYLLLRYDGENLVVAAKIPLEKADLDDVRACIADDYLYVLSDGGLNVLSR